MDHGIRRPRLLPLLGCGLLLATACGPAQPAPRNTTRPRTRPKPRPRPSDAPELIQLIFTDIELAVKRARGKKTLLGPILKEHVKTKIPKQCRGDVATDLFDIIKVPRKHKRLPSAKLYPGFVVFVRGKKLPRGRRPIPVADPISESRRFEFHLCAITAAPRPPDGTMAVVVQKQLTLSSGFARFGTTWREHPPSRAVLILHSIEHTTGADEHPGNPGDSVSQEDIIFAYEKGLFHRVHTHTTQMGRYNRGRIVWLSLRRPKRHLVVFVEVDSSLRTDPKTKREVETWKQTHEIRCWNKKRTGLIVIKGAALKKLLRHPKLAPYRKTLSGPGAGPEWNPRVPPP